MFMIKQKLYIPDWLHSIIESMRPLLRDVFALSLVLNILAVASPIFVLQVYDRVVSHNGLSTLAGLAIGMVIVLAADHIFRIVRSRILQRIALDLEVKISRRITDTFLDLPLRYLENKPGSYWQRIFHDTEVLRNMVSGGAAIILSDLPFLVLFLVLIAIVAQSILWVVLCFVIAFTALAYISSKMVSRRQNNERQSAHTRERLLGEVVNGRTTVKALALDTYIKPAIEMAQADHIDRSISRARLNDRFTATAHTLTMSSTVMIITFGALAILTQDLTMGGLIAGNMLASRLLQPLNQLVNTWRSFGAFKDSVMRLDDLFTQPLDRNETSLTPETITGTLILDNVQFGYDATALPTLSKLSLPLRHGGISAVIGPNGSGKTTLLKLLMGLYSPDEGRVLLDGGDISQYSRKDLAKWIGYAPQETFLLSGSIRLNILASAPDADDDALRDAAKFAGLDVFVRLLPKGYDTDVGEAGAIMSGGVRQRIGLARAVLQKPQILLLDEPTSHLDRVSEDHLRQSLIDYAKDHTVIIVSHSPALLNAARDILVLSLTGPAQFGPGTKVLQALAAHNILPSPQTGAIQP